MQDFINSKHMKVYPHPLYISVSYFCRNLTFTLMNQSIKLTLSLILSVLACQVAAQVVTCSRTASLHDGQYDLTGTAYLELFDDGALQLRLGDDFDTDAGPDVQIFLSNDSTSIAGALMVADIGPGDGINHFSGALTLPIESGTDINDYRYIILRCVSFQAYWGGGTWSTDCDGSNGGGEEPIDTMMMAEDMCFETIVATTNWASEVTLCPNDGLDDIIPLLNTDRIPAGDTYAYIFADDNNLITRIHKEDAYNFEGSSLETENIFGVSYRGTLSYNVGDPITSITSDSCFILSSMTTFLKVIKENCATQFDCQNTLTATTNWATTVNICPTDGQPDLIPFLNNEFIDPTAGHYAYVITDLQNHIQQVVMESSFDFEDSGLESNRVFGVSYDANLTYIDEGHITTLMADGCAQISDTTELFLTITKEACEIPVENNLTITGKIIAAGRSGIHGVEVSLNQDMTTTTNADGVYTFNNLGPGTYTIKPSVTRSSQNGLSSTDLVLTARHILGLNKFDNIFQIIAADANNSNSVSAVDLVQMRLVLLGKSDSYSNNSSWRFFDMDSDLTGTDLTAPLDEVKTVILESTDITDTDFVGIKIGDINGSASLDVRN